MDPGDEEEVGDDDDDDNVVETLPFNPKVESKKEQPETTSESRTTRTEPLPSVAAAARPAARQVDSQAPGASQ